MIANITKTKIQKSGNFAYPNFALDNDGYNCCLDNYCNNLYIELVYLHLLDAETT